jgi:hypothetical protein
VAIATTVVALQLAGIPTAFQEEDMSPWHTIGDRVLEILTMVREHPATFAAEARRRGITVDQPTAAAVVGVIAEAIDQGHRGTRQSRRTQRRKPGR